MKINACMDVSVPYQAPVTKNGHISVQQTFIYGKTISWEF